MLNIRQLDSKSATFAGELAQLLAFESAQDPKVEMLVRAILETVKTEGDAAVLDCTKRFDRWTPASAAALEIDSAVLKSAPNKLPAAGRPTCENDANHIPHIHRALLESA